MVYFSTDEELIWMNSLTSKTGSMEDLESGTYQALLNDEGDFVMIEISSDPSMNNFEEQLRFDATGYTSATAIENPSTFQPGSTATYPRPPDTGTTGSFCCDSLSSRDLPPPPSPPLLSFATESLDRRGWPWPLPSQITIPPPPAEPLPWAWRCHKCDRRWLLSVTRRCWHCGHYYCSGPSADSRRRRCMTEFDFIAWEEWATWKKQAMALKAYSQAPMDTEGRVIVRNPIIRGCEGCSFPSECDYDEGGPDEEVEVAQYLDIEKTRRRRSLGEETNFDSDESFEREDSFEL